MRAANRAALTLLHYPERSNFTPMIIRRALEFATRFQVALTDALSVVVGLNR